MPSLPWVPRLMPVVPRACGPCVAKLALSPRPPCQSCWRSIPWPGRLGLCDAALAAAFPTAPCPPSPPPSYCGTHVAPSLVRLLSFARPFCAAALLIAAPLLFVALLSLSAASTLCIPVHRRCAATDRPR